MASAEQATGPSISRAQIAAALVVQARVIKAMMLRETMSRYGDHKLGFVWALLEPGIMIALFVGFRTLMRSEDPGGMPLVPFMIAGFVPFLMFKNTMTQLRNAIGQNRSLLGFPQVTTFDVIMARAILELLIMLAVFALFLALGHLLGYPIRMERPLTVLLCCLMLATCGLGLGFIFASLSPIVPSSQQIANSILGRPLFLGSGLFYTADSIPMPFREWLLYNPLLHLIELLRSAFFFEFESTHASWSYATGWTLGLLALGLCTHQALRRRAIVGL